MTEDFYKSLNQAYRKDLTVFNSAQLTGSLSRPQSQLDIISEEEIEDELADKIKKSENSSSIDKTDHIYANFDYKSPYFNYYSGSVQQPLPSRSSFSGKFLLCFFFKNKSRK